jgi:hypothetical protein
MNFKKIENIKNSIEFFEDAEFYSMASKDKVIVKNVNNEVLWEVPFTMVENAMVFDGKQARIVGEDIFDDESDEEMIEEDVDAAYGQVGKLNDITKMILNEEIDMDILKEKIMSYQFKTEKTSNNYQSYEENVKENKKENKTKIYSLFSEQISKYEKEKQNFLNNGYLFNENDEIKKIFIVDPVYLTTLYEEKIEKTNKFFTFIENEYAHAMKVVEKVNSAFKGTDLPTNELFEGIDFTEKDNIKTKIVKNLLVIKKKHNLSYSLNEMTKKVDKLLSELYPMLEEFEMNGEEKFTNASAGLSQLATGDPRFPDRSLRFLKINFGSFNRDDVMKLMEELNLAINTLYNQEEDAESYRMLFVMRNAIDYMIRKNMIDDNIVINIIKTFNDRYGTDNKKDFNDAEKGLPFSSSVYGMKNMMPAVASEM